MKVYYSIENETRIYQIETHGVVINHVVASECAKHYHGTYHCGERDWPLVFLLSRDIDDAPVRYEVERVMKPMFHAKRIAKGGGQP